MCVISLISVICCLYFPAFVDVQTLPLSIYLVRRHEPRIVENESLHPIERWLRSLPGRGIEVYIVPKAHTW